MTSEKKSGSEIVRQLNECIQRSCHFLGCISCKRKISGGNYCTGCNGYMCGECTYEVVNKGRCKACNSTEGTKTGPVNDVMVNDLINLIHEYEIAVGREFLDKTILNVNDWKNMQMINKTPKSMFSSGYTSTPNRDSVENKNVNFTKDFTAIERDLHQPANCTINDIPMASNSPITPSVQTDQQPTTTVVTEKPIVQSPLKTATVLKPIQQSPVKNQHNLNVSLNQTNKPIVDTKHDSIQFLNEIPSKDSANLIANANQTSESNQPQIGAFGLLKSPPNCQQAPMTTGTCPPELDLINKLTQVCMNLKQMFDGMKDSNGVQMALTLPEIGQIKLELHPSKSIVSDRSKESVAVQTDLDKKLNVSFGMQTEQIEMKTVEMQTEAIEMIERGCETNRLQVEHVSLQTEQERRNVEQQTESLIQSSIAVQTELDESRPRSPVSPSESLLNVPCFGKQDANESSVCTDKSVVEESSAFELSYLDSIRLDNADNQSLLSYLDQEKVNENDDFNEEEDDTHDFDSQLILMNPLKPLKRADSDADKVEQEDDDQEEGEEAEENEMQAEESDVSCVLSKKNENQDDDDDDDANVEQEDDDDVLSESPTKDYFNDSDCSVIGESPAR